MQKVISVIWMIWNILSLAFDKILSVFLRKKTEKQKFLEQYENDGLWPVSPGMVEDLYLFAHCTSCGVCESLLTNIQNTKQEIRHFPLPQELVCGALRNLTSITRTRENVAVYQEYLKELALLCPEHIPFDRLVEIVRLHQEYEQTR